MGGEEMFVISGKFIDAYERSLHMRKHTPYVEQETLLWLMLLQLLRPRRSCKKAVQSSLQLLSLLL